MRSLGLSLTVAASLLTGCVSPPRTPDRKHPGEPTSASETPSGRPIVGVKYGQDDNPPKDNADFLERWANVRHGMTVEEVNDVMGFTGGPTSLLKGGRKCVIYYPPDPKFCMRKGSWVGYAFFTLDGKLYLKHGPSYEPPDTRRR